MRHLPTHPQQLSTHIHNNILYHLSQILDHILPKGKVFFFLYSHLLNWTFNSGREVAAHHMHGHMVWRIRSGEGKVDWCALMGLDEAGGVALYFGHVKQVGQR